MYYIAVCCRFFTSHEVNVSEQVQVSQVKVEYSANALCK